MNDSFRFAKRSARCTTSNSGNVSKAASHDLPL